MVSASPHLVSGYLLDSNIFIRDERGTFDLHEFVQDRPPASYAMSSVTAAELLLGVDLATPGHRARRRQNVDDYLAGFLVLDFDIHCARQWSTIAARLRAKGRNIGAHDLLIAATALHYNYGVITFNAQEFSRIPGLAVFTP